MPEKTTEKSGLPVATGAKIIAEYNSLNMALAKARTSQERKSIAEKAYKNRVHFELENILEMAWKYGELSCRAEYHCVHGDDFSPGKIAGSTISKMKKAYKKLSREDFEEKIIYAETEDIIPTRDFFLKKKWIGASGNDEYYTPFEVVQAARFAMNGIDLDPASNHIAQKVVEATKYYTKEDDGLSKEWSGRVF